MPYMSINKQLKKLEDDLNSLLPNILTEAADYLVKAPVGEAAGGSPVYSGAYVKSHSITTSSGNGRSRTSTGKPSANPAAEREEARALLYGDIAGIPKDTTKVYINNRSPHAMIVENGLGRTPAYKVYTGLRVEIGNIVSRAINKTKV